jgi:hypothetical protein
MHDACTFVSVRFGLLELSHFNSKAFPPNQVKLLIASEVKSSSTQYLKPRYEMALLEVLYTSQYRRRKPFCFIGLLAARWLIEREGTVAQHDTAHGLSHEASQESRIGFA